jgi:glycosyltransferase involved in cell wall biosynthesis
MQIKILCLTNSFHENSGGIRTFLLAMLQAAELKETPLSLLVPAEWDRAEDVGKFGRIYYVRARPSPFIDSRYHLLTPGRIYPNRSAVWRILNSEKPDLILITDKYMMPYLGGLIRKSWSPLTYRPTLVGMSCERMDDNVNIHLPPFPFRNKFIRWYLGNIYIPQFDAHIANSIYTAGELIDARAKKHWRPIEIATPGVDSTAFHPGCRSEKGRLNLLGKWQMPHTVKLLVYSGRLSHEKNPMLLMETMKELAVIGIEDFRMLIIGSGPSRQAMEKIAEKDLPGKVYFIDHIKDRHQLASMLSNCDAYLHPNPREPFGIAPLEAMACELPVVLPNEGGVQAYANSSNSWSVSADPSSYTRALLDVFKYPDDRRHRLKAARKTAESFQWEKVIRQLFVHFEQFHALQSVGYHQQQI